MTNEPSQHLSIVLDVDANTLAFGGSIESNVGLRDLLGGVPGDAGGMRGWVPNIAIEQAGIHFDPNPAGESFTAFVVAGVPGSATTSANVFIATLPTPPPKVNGSKGVLGDPKTAATAYVVGLDLTSTIDLGGTPLFGSLLSGISLQALGIVYASDDLPENAFILPPPARPGQPAFPKGLVLTVTITGGGATRTFTLSPSTKPPPQQALSHAGTVALRDEPGDQPGMQWFPVQKTFGPLTIGRLGLLTSDSRFGLGLDASVTTSAFSVGLTGFTVTFPIDRIDPSAICVQLDGLVLAFNSPSVTIAGSLLRQTVDDATVYNGAVLIQVGRFGIAAVGSYANLHGSPSLFIYGMAKGPFGGPPAFFVTGLAAGFGYNRSLRLPGFGSVADHPFLLAAKDGADFNKALEMLTEGGWVPPSVGDYWLAAGIQFTTFEIVRSFVLLTVQFGHELVFALLGIAAIRLPQIGPTYAYAELTIDAVLRPQEGTFKLTALLTPNSFVLDPACHLRGGFAAWVWFGDNEHAGDFVISLGGYHPLFDAPHWYPTLPRLGFDWNMSNAVHLTGGLYFALTPSCVMAGGSLDLTFQEGDLRAWFTAHVDMIIFWKPFYFVAGIGVSIGVSYTLRLGSLHRTFRLELGVDVELWGPPVAGVAKVTWWVISFTVNINGGGRPHPPGRTLKNWDTFAASFLPPPAAPPAIAAATTEPASSKSSMCRPRALRGLLRTIDDDQVWVISAADFVLATETVIPATEVVVGDPDHPAHHFEGPSAGVYPLGSVALDARHVVTMDRLGGAHPVPVDLAPWAWAPTSGSQPQALWGRQNSGTADVGAETVPVLIGATGAPTPAALSGPGPVSFAVLAYGDLPDRSLPLPVTPPIDGAAAPAPDPFTVLEDTLTTPEVTTFRDDIAAELQRVGVGHRLVGGDLTLLAGQARTSFPAPPMIGPLGSTGPRRVKPLPPGVALPSGRAPWLRPQPTRPRWVVRGRFRRSPATSLAGSAPVRTHTRHLASALQRSTHSQAQMVLAPEATLVLDTDPHLAHVLDLRGPARRVIALDDQHHPVFNQLCTGVVEVPSGVVTIVFDEAETDPAPAGWLVSVRLRQVTPHVALGDGGVLVRTQAPHPRSNGCGVVTGRALLTANRVAGIDPGDAVPGWIDTIVPAGLCTAVIKLEVDDDNSDQTPLSVMLAAGGRPHPSRVLHDVRPMASMTVAGRSHLILDLVPTGSFTHVMIPHAAADGWQVSGVTAFADAPQDILALAPWQGPEPHHVATSMPTPQEPTVVVWR